MLLTACGSWAPTAQLTALDFLHIEKEISFSLAMPLAYKGPYTTAFACNLNLDELGKQIELLSNQQTTYTMTAPMEDCRVIQVQSETSGSLLLLAEHAVVNTNIPTGWYRNTYLLSDFSATLLEEGTANHLFLFPTHLAKMDWRPSFENGKSVFTDLTLEECAAFYDLAGECYGIDRPYTIDGTKLTLNAAFVMKQPVGGASRSYSSRVVMEFKENGLTVQRSP